MSATRGNGASAEQPGEPDATERARAQTERAERAVSEFGERAGRWLASTAARVREEAEDVWAEAQAVRRGHER